MEALSANCLAACMSVGINWCGKSWSAAAGQNSLTLLLCVKKARPCHPSLVSMPPKPRSGLINAEYLMVCTFMILLMYHTIMFPFLNCSPTLVNHCHLIYYDS